MEIPRALIIVLIIFFFASALVTLFLSFFQINDEISNPFIGKVDCDIKGVIPPFYATLSINGTTSEVQCSWSTTRTLVRLLFLFLFLILSVICIVSLAIISKPLNIAAIVLIGLDAVLGFYCGIADAIDSRDGHTYCKNTMLNKSGNVDCRSYQFYGTVGMDIFTVFGMFVVVIVSSIQHRKIFKDQNSSGQMIK